MKKKTPLTDQIAKDKKLFELKPPNDSIPPGEQNQPQRINIDFSKIKTENDAEQALLTVIEAIRNNNDPEEEKRLDIIYRKLFYWGHLDV